LAERIGNDGRIGRDGFNTYNTEEQLMSKKHFNALADAIACIDNAEERARAARAVADVCVGFNGRFDRGRFLRACGVEG
jgi:hypothetical protein